MASFRYIRIYESVFPEAQWGHWILRRVFRYAGNIRLLNLTLICLQILNVVDIGTSFWTQFRNITHVADNFDFFDAIPKEEIPAEIQQSEVKLTFLYIKFKITFSRSRRRCSFSNCQMECNL